MRLTRVLVLAALLTAACRAGTQRSAMRHDAKDASGLEWAKDLSAKLSAEHTMELRRRALEGPVVHTRAVVQNFQATALSSMTKGQLAPVHIASTRVKILFPPKFEGLELSIFHATRIGDDSCWRVMGCIAEFDIPERLLDARQAGMQEIGLIYDRDLKNLSLMPKPADKPAPRLKQE
jgi:hypothetical protein